MTLDINQIKTELHGLEKSYYQMTFRNKNSLLTLLDMYKKVDNYREAIMEDFPQFSPDPLNKVIINNLMRLLEDEQTKRDKLEWAFFHYNDLFIFRISDLLITMELELV